MFERKDIGPIPKNIPPAENGAELILIERKRQISEEGWLPDHDDAHANGELAAAGALYAHVAEEQALQGTIDFEEFYERRENDWPWDKDSFNPKEDPLRNLVRA